MHRTTYTVATSDPHQPSKATVPLVASVRRIEFRFDTGIGYVYLAFYASAADMAANAVPVKEVTIAIGKADFATLVTNNPLYADADAVLWAWLTATQTALKGAALVPPATPPAASAAGS